MARLDSAKKHLKKPDHFWKSILWMAEIKINLYQNDRKKKVWRRLGTAHDLKHTTPSVKHGGAVRWHEHAWLPVALGYWCLVMMRQKQLEEFWCVQGYTVCLDSAKCSKVDWTALHSTNGRWPKSKATQEFLKVKRWNILQWPSQSPDLNLTELHFTCWRQN